MFLCCFTICTAFTVAIAVSNEDLESEWQMFKAEYGKNYLSATEETRRFQIFSENRKFIEQHNENFMNDLSPYGLGITQFADLTHEEYLNNTTCFKATYDGKEEWTDMSEESVEDADLPEEVDWRDEGYVTPVKTQRRCNSCWAFSTTGSLEGQHFRATGKLLSLSEQNLIDCNRHHNGCKSGNQIDALNYIKKNGGIDTEEAYPYRGVYGKCRFKKYDVGATVRGFVNIKSNSEMDLKRAVATVGPVSITINSRRRSFQHYTHGVYDDPGCTVHGLNHAVLAVGYGVMNGKKYWIVKNSWGTTWGKQGYVLMSRDKHNQCGVATYAMYPLV